MDGSRGQPLTYDHGFGLSLGYLAYMPSIWLIILQAIYIHIFIYLIFIFAVGST